MPMVCLPLKEDLFAGVAWSAVVALLALEKLRQGETLNDDERLHVSRTAAFASAMLRPMKEEEALTSEIRDKDSRRHRRFWIVSDASAPQMRDAAENLVSSLDQSSLHELTAGELVLAQKNLLALVGAINLCRAR